MATMRRILLQPLRKCRWTHWLLVIILVNASLLLAKLLLTDHVGALIQLPYTGRHPFSKRGSNIFFIESTCAIKDAPWHGLRPRQACAVESAARHAPGARVLLLHTCAAPAGGLALPPGVAAVHTPLDSFLRDTPLHRPLLQAGALAASHWPVEHASDVMRLVALWKYGGAYFDLDFVILRDLTPLGEDWAGAEDDFTVANSALSLSAEPGSPGQQVAAAAVAALRDDFDGRQWTYNGPALLTRTLHRRCNATITEDMRDCGGFRVLAAPLLCPLHYSQWPRLFSDEPADVLAAEASLSGAYAVHLWNKLSVGAAVPPNSTYATIARDNCPHTYSAAAAAGRF